MSTRARVAALLFKGAGHLLSTDEFSRCLDYMASEVSKLNLDAADDLERLAAIDASKFDMYRALPGLFGLQDLLGEHEAPASALPGRASAIDEMLAFAKKRITRESRLSALSKTEPKAEPYASLAPSARGHGNAVVGLLREYCVRLEGYLGAMEVQTQPTASSSSSSVPVGRGDAKPSPGSRTVQTEAALSAASFALGSGPTPPAAKRSER